MKTITTDIEIILEKCDKYKLTVEQKAYVLATVEHETDATYKPIREYGDTQYFTDMYEGREDLGNIRPGDGIRFIGRGYPQLTGRRNYEKYGKILGIPLADNPELAMDAKYSAEILVHGMTYGIFTGRKLSDYIAGSRTDYVGARVIINGNDRDRLIAGYAKEWLKFLETNTPKTVSPKENSFISGLASGLSIGAAPGLPKLMRQYKASGDQELLLDWLHLAIQKLDNTLIWRFAKAYRNNEDGSDIDFNAVAEWYEAMPHQVKALNQLESDLNTRTTTQKALEIFTTLWPIVTAEYIDPNHISIVESGYQPKDPDYTRLYKAMTHNFTRVPGKGSTEEYNIQRMVLELQKMEKALGVRVSLTSGYRPEPINSEVGGVPNSEHTKGLAADCYSEDMEDMKFEAEAATYWRQNQLGGVGWGMANRGFVHLDLGPVREWQY